MNKPMSDSVIRVNGQRMPAVGAHISVEDRGFLLADGIFETVRLYDGIPFRLDAHLARMQRSASALHLTGVERMEDEVHAALADARDAGIRDGMLRFTLTRGRGFGVQLPADPQPTLAVLVRPFGGRNVPTPEGVRALIASGRRNDRAPSAGHKTLSYTDAVLSLAEAAHRGAAEAVMLDTRDRVSGVSYGNIFLIAGDELATPSLDCGVLPGITRAAVLELATSAGLRPVEREIARAELFSAAEMFATSSVREIVPIVRLDDQDVGSGGAGDRTRTLMAHYAQLVQQG
jgi:branched-chain amino acid aminotransferase